jgi:hypothetical protein
MVPTIRVDDDVYEWLQQRAKPFVDTPNSVLRRELGITDTVPTPAAGSRPAPGELAPLLLAGELQPGDELVWKRRHVTHRAVVTADGWLQLADGQVFASPSGAGKKLSGYENSGWKSWRRGSDGMALSALRDRL